MKKIMHYSVCLIEELSDSLKVIHPGYTGE